MNQKFIIENLFIGTFDDGKGGSKCVHCLQPIKQDSDADSNYR